MLHFIYKDKTQKCTQCKVKCQTGDKLEVPAVLHQPIHHGPVENPSKSINMNGGPVLRIERHPAKKNRTRIESWSNLCHAVGLLRLGPLDQSMCTSLEWFFQAWHLAWGAGAAWSWLCGWNLANKGLKTKGKSKCSLILICSVKLLDPFSNPCYDDLHRNFASDLYGWQPSKVRQIASG